MARSTAGIHSRRAELYVCAPLSLSLFPYWFEARSGRSTKLPWIHHPAASTVVDPDYIVIGSGITNWYSSQGSITFLLLLYSITNETHIDTGSILAQEFMEQVGHFGPSLFVLSRCSIHTWRHILFLNDPFRSSNKNRNSFLPRWCKRMCRYIIIVGFSWGWWIFL